MIVEAIKSLRPNAQWSLNGDTLDGLVWLDEEQTRPTNEEIINEAERLDNTPYIPSVVSAYQAKMALLNAGLYYNVENMVNTSNNMQLKIAWNNATEFQKDNPLILSLMPQLGLNEENINNLFIEASKIK